MKDEFKSFGKIKEIIVDKYKNKGIFIKFKKIDNAISAKKYLKNKMLKERPIICYYFKSKIFDYL